MEIPGLNHRSWSLILLMNINMQTHIGILYEQDKYHAQLI